MRSGCPEVCARLLDHEQLLTHVLPVCAHCVFCFCFTEQGVYTYPSGKTYTCAMHDVAACATWKTMDNQLLSLPARK